MNAYGNPDTMMIDPVLSYKVVAHTIPPVSIDNITLTPGKHTIIPLSTPQGELEIKMNSKIKYQFIVRPAGVDTTLNVQEIPRQKFIDVEVNQSSKTQYTIPTPALANIILPSKGYGGLYVKNGDKLDLIYPFYGNKSQHRLTLLPGNYKVVFRALAAKEYIYTKEKDFKLKSGQSKLIKFY
jgi:Ca-activated chloride channel family protein